MLKSKKPHHFCRICNIGISNFSAHYGSGLCNVCVNKGKKLTEEHKRKIKESSKPYNFKKGHLINIGKTPWNKGKKYSHTEEVRNRLRKLPSLFKSGEQHPNWKGGTSTINKLIRECEEYNRWRKDIFKRDNYKCRLCESKNIIEVHHIFPLYKIIEQYKIKSLIDAYNCKVLWERKNGVVLCKKCHNHTKGGRFKN
jgi:hypothetical protein